MNMNAQYNRAVRIVSEPGQPHGHAVTIYDKETGESLFGIKSAVIYLDANKANMVELTYYETNGQGNIITDSHGPILRTTTIHGDHKIDITAYEVNE